MWWPIENFPQDVKHEDNKSNKSSVVDITKCVCERCLTVKVSKKDQSGIFLNYRGKEIPFCNACAVELANLMLDAVKENDWMEIK